MSIATKNKRRQAARAEHSRRLACQRAARRLAERQAALNNNVPRYWHVVVDGVVHAFRVD